MWFRFRYRTIIQNQSVAIQRRFARSRVPSGSVAQIRLRSGFPFAWIASSDAPSFRCSWGREAVQDCGSDLQLGNLPVEIARLALSDNGLHATHESDTLTEALEPSPFRSTPVMRPENRYRSLKRPLMTSPLRLWRQNRKARPPAVALLPSSAFTGSPARRARSGLIVPPPLPRSGSPADDPPDHRRAEPGAARGPRRKPRE